MRNADWVMTVRVRLNNALEHDEPNAKLALHRCIADEGGPLQVIAGWCEPDDLEVLSLEPIPTSAKKAKS